MSSASAPDATHSQQLVHNWVYIVFWSAVAGEERGNVIRVAPAAVVDSSTNNKWKNHKQKRKKSTNQKKKQKSRAKQSAINHRDVEYTIPRYTETNKKRK